MFGFLGDIGSGIMTPLYYAVSAVLLGWHWLFSQVFDKDSGWTWALAIVGLTLTIRTALIPLFVKQIKSSRNMQLLQPKIKELQKKYGHDRERLTQEQMKLWKETGTNPFASCMPLLLQMPIFFALFRTIDHASKYNPKTDGTFSKGFLDSADAISLSNAHLLGARIADTFVNSPDIETKIFTMALVVVMCITQFLTQRQLMTKNMPPDAMSGQYAQQQKMLLYVLPFVFAIGGVAFPLGVLFYWTTSNAWTMGQQFYVIRNNPVPGTPAAKAKAERDARHGKTPPAIETSDTVTIEKEPKPPARQQPKNQPRSQRKKKPATPPPGKKKPPASPTDNNPLNPDDKNGDDK